MGSNTDLCLRWNDHHRLFFSSAENLCRTGDLCDVTLSTGGGVYFQAHKLVLTVCSTYFHDLFTHCRPRSSGNTIVYLKNVSSKHLELLLTYMYRGEVNVQESELIQFLSTASDLQIQGLSDMPSVKSKADVTGCDRETKIKRECPPSLPVRPLQQQDGGGGEGESRAAERPAHLSPRVGDRESYVPNHQDYPKVQMRRSSNYNPYGGSNKRPLDTLRESGDVGDPSSQHPRKQERWSNNRPSPDSVEHYPSSISSQNTSEMKQDQNLYSSSENKIERGKEVMVEGEVDDYSDYQDPQDYSTPDTFGDSYTDQKETEYVRGGSLMVMDRDKKAFPCDVCDMSFNQKWLLKRHYKTHTRERPFKCSLCNKNFTLRDSCLRHIRTVHRSDLDAGDINLSNIATFCQYEETGDMEGMSGPATDLPYSNEALAVTLA